LVKVVVILGVIKP